jgi:hypothetical protein
VPACQLGHVGSTLLTLNITGYSPRQYSWEVSALHQVWDTALDVCLS